MYAIITALVVVALVGIFVRVVIKKDEIKGKLEPLLSKQQTLGTLAAQQNHFQNVVEPGFGAYQCPDEVHELKPRAKTASINKKRSPIKKIDNEPI